MFKFLKKLFGLDNKKELTLEQKLLVSSINHTTYFKKI